MLRVYNYMAIGLFLTGVAAFGGYLAAVTSTPPNMRSGRAVPDQLRLRLFVSPLKWVVMLAPLGPGAAPRLPHQQMSVGGGAGDFSGSMRRWSALSLSTIFLVYTEPSIAQIFFITAATFGALSLWGYTTKRDLTGMGSFLFMGLIGIIIAMLVNIFLRSPALDFAISVIGVLVFAGLTAYDTQKIKEDVLRR